MLVRDIGVLHLRPNVPLHKTSGCSKPNDTQVQHLYFIDPEDGLNQRSIINHTISLDTRTALDDIYFETVKCLMQSLFL